MTTKIIQIKSEMGSAFNFILEKPPDFNFYPGQYLDIILKGTRAFTISSSPTEDFLMITPQKGISEFKKCLASLKPGNTIESSHPAGTFTLDESSPAVFIAGGIGITPFRSMIKYAFDQPRFNRGQKLSTPITLIYSNSDDNFLFKEELDKWSEDLTNLSIIYLNTTNQGRLNLSKLAMIVQKNDNVIYYLAGSHEFVNDMAKILIDYGIDETNIRYDRFDGY